MPKPISALDVPERAFGDRPRLGDDDHAGTPRRFPSGRRWYDRYLRYRWTEQGARSSPSTVPPRCPRERANREPRPSTRDDLLAHCTDRLRRVTMAFAATLTLDPRQAQTEPAPEPPPRGRMSPADLTTWPSGHQTLPTRIGLLPEPPFPRKGPVTNPVPQAQRLNKPEQFASYGGISPGGSPPRPGPA